VSRKAAVKVYGLNDQRAGDPDFYRKWDRYSRRWDRIKSKVRKGNLTASIFAKATADRKIAWITETGLRILSREEAQGSQTGTTDAGKAGNFYTAKDAKHAKRGRERPIHADDIRVEIYSKLFLGKIIWGKKMVRMNGLR
jgi:hypothetical protein